MASTRVYRGGRQNSSLLSSHESSPSDDRIVQRYCIMVFFYQVSKMTMQERLFRAIGTFLPKVVTVEAALCTSDVYVAKERMFVTNDKSIIEAKE